MLHDQSTEVLNLCRTVDRTGQATRRLKEDALRTGGQCCPDHLHRGQQSGTVVDPQPPVHEWPDAQHLAHSGVDNAGQRQGPGTLTQDLQRQQSCLLNAGRHYDGIGPVVRPESTRDRLAERRDARNVDIVGLSLLERTDGPPEGRSRERGRRLIATEIARAVGDRRDNRGLQQRVRFVPRKNLPFCGLSHMFCRTSLADKIPTPLPLHPLLRALPSPPTPSDRAVVGRAGPVASHPGIPPPELST